MQIQNVPIHKGPDKWLLAESLFHDDEFPDDLVYTSFMVKHEGREYRLRVATVSIGKPLGEEGLYRIEGVADVITTGPNREKVLEHVPVKISYSVKDRKGIANVNF
jgi:hypothetical protein